MNTRTIKLSATIIGISLLLMACSPDQPQQTATVDPYLNNGVLTEADQDDYWAKDNLDLQRVGTLLERSGSPQEFESYLNSDDGINNLDLNGDGYADYISVDEFEDRGDNERGLSLFSRFGPDLIQEVASIIFHRDDNNWPGARVLLRGNEQLYGDDYYYETNWADRSLAIVNTLFGNRDEYYRSPYYYDNYPSDYQVYQVVETPVYRARIESVYPEPVFIYTTAPSVRQVKIRSPHNGKSMDKIYARLAKPTKEQTDFRRRNPGPPQFGGVERGEKGRRNDDKGGRRPDNPPKDERRNDGERGKPSKPDKIDKQNAKPPRSEDGKSKGGKKGGGKKKP